MRRTSLAVPVLIAASACVALLVPQHEARAQNRRWRSCLCGCRDNKSPREWADEAAALGVKGGAPALGFCGSVTGYEAGVIRIPDWMMKASNANAVGVPASSTPMNPGAVPPPPAPSATGSPGVPTAPPMPGPAIPAPQ
jgi:hypothetical protein